MFVRTVAISNCCHRLIPQRYVFLHRRFGFSSSSSSSSIIVYSNRYIKRQTHSSCVLNRLKNNKDVTNKGKNNIDKQIEIVGINTSTNTFVSTKSSNCYNESEKNKSKSNSSKLGKGDKHKFISLEILASILDCLKETPNKDDLHSLLT